MVSGISGVGGTYGMGQPNSGTLQDIINALHPYLDELKTGLGIGTSTVDNNYNLSPATFQGVVKQLTDDTPNALTALKNYISGANSNNNKAKAQTLYNVIKNATDFLNASNNDPNDYHKWTQPSFNSSNSSYARVFYNLIKGISEGLQNLLGEDPSFEFSNFKATDWNAFVENDPMLTQQSSNPSFTVGSEISKIDQQMEQSLFVMFEQPVKEPSSTIETFAVMGKLLNNMQSDFSTEYKQPTGASYTLNTEFKYSDLGNLSRDGYLNDILTDITSITECMEKIHNSN